MQKIPSSGIFLTLYLNVDNLVNLQEGIYGLQRTSKIRNYFGAYFD